VYEAVGQVELENRWVDPRGFEALTFRLPGGLSSVR
jgi:hypothetical protein